jgi:RNA polymerase sigma-70 factor (ECF subfamily)
MGDSEKLDQWVERSTQGDRAALESALLHFHDPLLNFIRKLLATHNPGSVTAEDALQETFIEAFRHIESLDARGSAAFFGWLKTIARTRLSNLLKAQRAQKRGGGRKHVQKSDDATATSVFMLIAGADPTPSVILRRKEAVGAIQEALTELEPEKRRIMVLRYGQGMSIEAVSAMIGKSEGAVKMIINRCIKELRRNLDQQGDFTAGA